MMNKKANYQIVKSTERAYMLAMDGVYFWIPKTWISSDGSLSRSAMLAYEKAQKASAVAEINVDELLKKAEGALLQNKNILSLVLVWLRELTALQSLLFEHQKMRDPGNKIFTIDVHSHVAQKLKNTK